MLQVSAGRKKISNRLSMLASVRPWAIHESTDRSFTSKLAAECGDRVEVLVLATRAYRAERDEMMVPVGYSLEHLIFQLHDLVNEEEAVSAEAQATGSVGQSAGNREAVDELPERAKALERAKREGAKRKDDDPPKRILVIDSIAALVAPFTTPACRPYLDVRLEYLLVLMNRWLKGNWQRNIPAAVVLCNVLTGQGKSALGKKFANLIDRRL